MEGGWMEGAFKGGDGGATKFLENKLYEKLL